MFYGWYVAAAAFVVLMVTVGIPFYGMPFFYDYFIAEFGWTRGQTTSGIALATILIQPLGGLLVHRFSPRKLILFGIVMLCLSLCCFALGDGSLPFYYLAWCIFMVGYLYSGPLPHQVILTQWFRRRRGAGHRSRLSGAGCRRRHFTEVCGSPAHHRIRVAVRTDRNGRLHARPDATPGVGCP